MFDIFLLLAITLGAGVLFFQSLCLESPLSSPAKVPVKKSAQTAHFGYGVADYLFTTLPLDFDLKGVLLATEKAFREALAQWRDPPKHFIAEAYAKYALDPPQKAVVYHRKLMGYTHTDHDMHLTLRFLYVDEEGKDPFTRRFKAVGAFHQKKNSDKPGNSAEGFELTSLHSVDCL